MKPSPKSPTKAPKCYKNWHGSHWHFVGWMAAVAIVLSTATMTLAASAESTPVTPTALLRSINDVKAQLSRMESDIEQLNAKVDTIAPSAAE